EETRAADGARATAMRDRRRGDAIGPIAPARLKSRFRCGASCDWRDRMRNASVKRPASSAPIELAGQARRTIPLLDSHIWIRYLLAWCLEVSPRDPGSPGTDAEGRTKLVAHGARRTDRPLPRARRAADARCGWGLPASDVQRSGFRRKR